jgi:uncharacterized protein YdaU (DUF1376 family)
MARLPIMPVFPRDLIADTAHLSPEQFGAYCRILFHTWIANGQALADDERRMAHLVGVSVHRWRTHLRPVLVEFFDLGDGHWHQKRLEAEWAKALTKSTKARKSANDRWKEDNRQDRLSFPEANAEADALADAPAPSDAIHRQSQEDSPSCSNPEAVAAKEVEKPKEGNPVERAARALAVNRPRPKTPALRAQIKAQLAWKHCRFLSARGRPGEAADYFSRIDAKTCLPPPELFEAVDARMRAARWDDMRAWKAQNGIRA